MSGIGSSRPLAPLKPVWSIDQPETLLWRGAGRVTGQRADRETELVVTWQPELDVRFRHEPDDAEDLELFLDEERGEARLRLPELGVDTRVPIPIAPLACFAVCGNEFVLVETLTGEQRLDDSDEVDIYIKAFDQLRVASVTGPEAIALIRHVIDELRAS